MYLKFFGFREQPFGVTPDPRFLYLSPSHREAMASLDYGIEANRGFLGLIARPGMGKTTLLFHLLERFRTTARTAFLFQTQCTSREFMRFLLVELGYEGDTQDFVKMHDEFNKRLLHEARAGRRFIVVIDEAQNLKPAVLETVRLLSDFETPRAKLLQIILAGQPELADKLASQGMAQLRQRISMLNRLEPLPPSEVRKYVDHRLGVAGYRGESLFTPEALTEICDFTEGIPRNVNNFCFNALSLACALQQKVVDSAVVQEVISDLDISRLGSGLPAPGMSQQPPLDRSSGPVEVLDVQDQYVTARIPVGQSLPPSPSVPIRGHNGATLSPAEAKAYMQQIADRLKDWQDSLNRSVRATGPSDKPN